uniref:FG-GAP-like repeat-containing protein n=1 Tax=Roseivirga sp. TaxID=1964215 RepID=UPI004056E011
SPESNYIRLVLKGGEKNKFAIGSKIYVTSGKTTYYIENQPVRGFQSSMDPRPLLGLNSNADVNIKVVWPLGDVTVLNSVPANRTVTIDYNTAMKEAQVPLNTNSTITFSRINTVPDYLHKENEFSDFDLDRSLFMMKSTGGPKMSIGDVNNDGLDDIYIGGSRDTEGTILIGTQNGYKPTSQVAFQKDKISEDTESAMFDADGDGDLDLYVCSGGIEYSENSSALNDRLYFNNGKGNFTLSNQMLPETKRFISSATVVSADIDGDGDIDLFVGEGSKPLKNGIPGDGFILENDGKGNFTDITAARRNPIENLRNE